MAIAKGRDLHGWLALTAASPDGPHADWLRDTGFVYVPPRAGLEVWIPLLIKLRNNFTAAGYASYHWAGSQADQECAKDWIRIPAMYRTPPTNLRANRFLTAMVTPRFFGDDDEVQKAKNAIEAFEVGAAYITPGPSTSKSQQIAVGGAPKEVLCAIIDDGFAFAHERFRRSDGSCRVAFVWDQDGPQVGVPVAYGKEIANSDIDVSLDEDSIYAELALDYSQTGFKPLGHRFSHGSVALDLAYGLSSATVGASERLPIVAVKLPNRVTENPSDLDLDPWVIDAFYYIQLRADTIALELGSAPLPIVVTMSYATTHHPHDGTSLIEQTIDSWVAMRTSGAPPVPTTVVLPAGNAYLSRMHASLALPAGQGAPPIAWCVPPDNRASSWSYIYVKPALPGGTPSIKVALKDPFDRQSDYVGVGQKVPLNVDGRMVAQLIYRPSIVGLQDMIALWVAPTASFDPSLPLAPWGKWTILIDNQGSDCEVNGWIRRSESPPGHPPSGRQSYFDDREYVIYDPISGRASEVDNTSHIKRKGTLSSMATGDKTVVAGGALRLTQVTAIDAFDAANYSGAGLVPGLRAGHDPDVTAPTEDAVTLHGVLGITSRSGGAVATNGTSVAAPQAARLAWNLLRAGGKATRVEIQAAATPTPGISPERGGVGCLVRAPITPRGGVRR